MLERLVENGFDFLNKAIGELEDYPKFSVIHFHAAVELFLKARLMEEHWSLVISNRQDPDWSKFISGNFQSISLDGAADRLEKVVRSGLTKAELTSFRDITKHRNKVVHFFHEAHSAEENREQVRDIVKQQLTAWYFLHHILTKRWDDVFSKWSTTLFEIDRKLRSLHTFLQVVFDQIKSKIDTEKAKGELFQCCPSCGFEAQHHESVHKEVYEANCRVCDLSEKALKIICSSCDGVITFISEGFGSCDNCKKRFEPDDLADELNDKVDSYLAVKDGDSYSDFGHCSDCDGYHTVVRLGVDSYICTSCFLTLESLQCCGWCNELNTGDMEDSLWGGCNHCDGREGWDRDD